MSSMSGIALVAELEVPAARLGLDAPGVAVAGDPDLLLQEPADRPEQARVEVGHLRSRPGRSWRSPYPRPASGRAGPGSRRLPRSGGLRAARAPIADGGRVAVVAQAFEGHDRVDHRREDRAEAVGVLEVVEHPAVGRLDPGLPQDGRDDPVGQLQGLVEPEEEVLPRDRRVLPLAGRRRLRGTARRSPARAAASGPACRPR